MTNEQKLQIAAYRKAGLGYKQIAKEMDLSANSVKSYCRRNGLSNEALEQCLPESACENCGKRIRNLWQKVVAIFQTLRDIRLPKNR